MNHAAKAFRRLVEAASLDPASPRVEALIQRLKRNLTQTPTAVGVAADVPRCLRADSVATVIDVLKSAGVAITARHTAHYTIVYARLEVQ